MQVLAPPGVYLYAVPKNTLAAVALPPPADPNSFNRGSLRARIPDRQRAFVASPDLRFRPSAMGVNATRESMAAPLPATAYNIGRLQTNVRRSEPIGVPPTAAES